MAKENQVKQEEIIERETVKRAGLTTDDVTRILSTDYGEYFRHGQEIAQRMRGKGMQ